jgi:penicillin-binding protein 1B
MKKAVALPEFSDVKPFSQPQGVIDVQLDKITNRLATPSCPDDYTIAFVAGTEPRDTCDQGNSGIKGFFSRIFGGSSEKALPPPTAPPPGQTGTPPGNTSAQTAEEEAKKKKGFFGKIVGAFKGDTGSQKTDSNGSNNNNNSTEKQSPAPPPKVGDGSVPPQ